MASLKELSMLLTVPDEQAGGWIRVDLHEPTGCSCPMAEGTLRGEQNQVGRIVVDDASPLIRTGRRMQNQLGNLRWVDRLVTAVAKDKTVRIEPIDAVLPPLKRTIEIPLDLVVLEELYRLNRIVLRRDCHGPFCGPGRASPTNACGGKERNSDGNDSHQTLPQSTRAKRLRK